MASPSLPPSDSRRSGGKIMRARQHAASARTTPYERPSPRVSDPENPNDNNNNWLSKLILSPSRLIASGAGKLISTVFSPSSSSSSSSSGEFSSEYESDNEAGDGGVMAKTSEMNDSEPQPVEWRKETKKLIEQLVMQETFSREECDRLVSLIESRVVDPPIYDNSTRDDSAAMQGKRWLEEKQLGSTSRPELDQGTPLPNVAQGEAGSPVDIAKSYMQTRPLWQSPTTMGLQLFKEDRLSVGGNSASSSKMKKDSLVSGTWNIQDEIRKVRSKATEEMLKNLPSAEINWSEIALETENNRNSAEKNDDGLGDRRDASEEILSSGKKLKLSDSGAGAVNVDGMRDTNGMNQYLGSVDGGAFPDIHDRERSAPIATAVTGDAVPVNGVHNLESSEPVYMDAEANHREPGEHHEGLSSDKANVHMEACELLSEAPVEVPFNEQDGIAIGSQNNPNGEHEEPSQNLSQPRKIGSPYNTRAKERLHRERGSKLNRRSKGRAK